MKYIKTAAIIAFAIGMAGCADSNLQQVVNMTAKELTSLEKSKGLSGAEKWGRWTDASTVSFTFKENLPENFRLLLMVSGSFGSNNGKEFLVHAGSQSKTFKGPAGPQFIQLDFNKVPSDTKDIVIQVPDARSPKDLGVGNDARKLGLGLVFVAIEPVNAEK